MKKFMRFAMLSVSCLALASCGKETTPQTETKPKTEQNTSTKGKPTTTTVASTTKDEGNGINYVEYDAKVTKGTTSGEYGLADSVQDGAILHAWNWSYNTIKNNMKIIAQCGYTAVQTSPVQQPKSTATSGAWSSEWSKLYQPVAFAVAESSYLGTKEELKAMCDEANKYGVKVVVDIVVNHMANNDKGEALSYSDRILQYEPEIYNNVTKYFHQEKANVSDSNAKTVTQYELSNLADLNTSEEYVQERVCSLLKECIDLGVSGFRFDAAKHIETPDDGAYASNFWPTILESATKYAKEKNREMFYYGEILNTPGGGRKYSSYTKYMSITDSSYSNTLLQATRYNTSEYYTKYLNQFNVGESTNAVVWAESHDTYADGTTKSKTTDLMNRVYAAEMSHDGAAALYFARPNEDTAMGDAGEKAWKSQTVAAVNHFRNKHLGEKEVVSLQDNYLVSEHGDTSCMIVSMAQVLGARTVTVECKNLKDGTYYDQVSGSEFTAVNGVLTGTISTAGIVVLETTEPSISPEITASIEKGYFYDELNVTLSVKNATSASYTINGDTKAFTNTTDVKVTSTTNTATLEVNALNGDISSSEKFVYTKVAKKEGYTAVAGLKGDANTVYYAWVWYKNGSATSNSHWAEVVVENGVAYIKEEANTNSFLLVSFDKSFAFDSYLGTSSSDPWASKMGQTADYDMSASVIYTSTI